MATVQPGRRRDAGGPGRTAARRRGLQPPRWHALRFDSRGAGCDCGWRPAATVLGDQILAYTEHLTRSLPGSEEVA